MEVIKLRRGDTFSYAAQIRTGGVAQDLSGWAVEADAQYVNTPTTVQAITVTVVDAAQGLVSLAIDAAATASLATGYWHLQIRLTTPAGVKSSSEPAVIAVRT